jgi:hypothetical protein
LSTRSKLFLSFDPNVQHFKKDSSQDPQQAFDEERRRTLRPGQDFP